MSNLHHVASSRFARYFSRELYRFVNNLCFLGTPGVSVPLHIDFKYPVMDKEADNRQLGNLWVNFLKESGGAFMEVRENSIHMAFNQEHDFHRELISEKLCMLATLFSISLKDDHNYIILTEEFCRGGLESLLFTAYGFSVESVLSSDSIKISWGKK